MYLHLFFPIIIIFYIRKVGDMFYVRMRKAYNSEQVVLHVLVSVRGIRTTCIVLVRFVQKKYSMMWIYVQFKKKSSHEFIIFFKFNENI